MSTMDIAFHLPQARPLLVRSPMRGLFAGRGPWGFWESLGWGLFAVATGLLASIIFTVMWMQMHQFHAANPQDAFFATTVGIVASVAPLAVIIVAARIRNVSLRYYFALYEFGGRDLVLGIVCLAVLIVSFGAVESLLGIGGGPTSMEATYRAAKLAGALPLLWLATVVVAPVTEELLFRGFLHRSWAPSWLGVDGTIVLTSALWAMLHQQYSAIGILLIFLMGLIFGRMRQRSGSTMLPIVLHALNNLFVTIIVTIQVEWLG